MDNAGLYDLILTFLVTACLVWNGVLSNRYRSLKVEVLRLRSRAADAPRSTPIKQARAHHGVPSVDAKARTTVRDTDDLPRTGRMSQGVKRVKSNARQRSDSELPES